MPHFRFNEGDLELPDDWADKSVYLFAVGSKQPPALSFVITRDDLEPGKELASFADEKLDDLSGQLQGFKLLEKRQVEVSGKVGLEAEFTWRSSVGVMHQRQTYVQHRQRILVLTATARREIRDEHRAQIDAVVSSLKLDE
jgi:hypothetical protein